MTYNSIAMGHIEMWQFHRFELVIYHILAHSEVDCYSLVVVLLSAVFFGEVGAEGCHAGESDIFPQGRGVEDIQIVKPVSVGPSGFDAVLPAVVAFSLPVNGFQPGAAQKIENGSAVAYAVEDIYDESSSGMSLSVNGLASVVLEGYRPGFR